MIWIRAKEKGLEFHVDVDRTMPSQLYGDEVRIKQILINVLNNAVKYTSEWSVTLSIQCKRDEGGKAQISYTVTDTGIGIKKDSIPYLFTAFKKVAAENEIGDINLEARHSMNSRSHYKQSFEASNAQVLFVDDNETNLLVAENF